MMMTLLGTAGAASILGGAIPPPVGDRPDDVPEGSLFGISATDGVLWTDTGGVAASLLSPASASFTGGGNGLALDDAGEYQATTGSGPRRSYDAVNSAWTYLTSAQTLTLSNGVTPPPAVVLPSSPDYVVHGGVGSDSNAGTEAAPFATFEPVFFALQSAPAGSTIEVLVKRPANGRYDMQHWSYVGNGGMNGSTLKVYYAPDCEMHWDSGPPLDANGDPILEGDTTTPVDDYGAGTPAYGVSSGHSPFYSNDGTIEPYGNGLFLSGYYDLGSAQIIGAFGDGICRGYDLKSEGSGDAMSGHTPTDFVSATRCEFRNFLKAGYANVGGSSGYMEDSSIVYDDTRPTTDAPVVVDGQTSGLHQFVRSRFECTNPGFASGATPSTMQFYQCIIGDDVNHMNPGGGGYYDSWLNARFFGRQINFIADRCFGRMTERIQDLGNSVISNGVFTGGGGSETRFILPNTARASYELTTVTNTIVIGFTVGVELVDSASAGKWSTAGSTITDSHFFGNGSDFDAAATGELGTTITNSVTGIDPQVTGGTKQQADFYPANSVAGFNASTFSGVDTTGWPQAAIDTLGNGQTGPRPIVDDQWSYLASDLGLTAGDTIRYVNPDGSTEDVVIGATVTLRSAPFRTVYGPITA